MNNLIDVYNDTIDKTEYLGKGVTKQYTFNDIITKKGYKKPIVKVIPNNSIDTALSVNKHTAILNMASHKRPGGGVGNGKVAQEECLFRSTNLWNCISKDYYPLAENVCLYTKNALIIKDGNYNLLENYIKADFITIPAINLNGKDMPENYDLLTENKIKLMFSVAYINNCSNIVLGSWGCGVFKNNPEYIAKKFKSVINDMGSLFDNITFGIINDDNSVDNNYEIFKNILDNE